MLRFVTVAEPEQIWRIHFNDFTGALVVVTNREGEFGFRCLPAI